VGASAQHVRGRTPTGSWVAQLCDGLEQEVERVSVRRSGRGCGTCAQGRSPTCVPQHRFPQLASHSTGNSPLGTQVRWNGSPGRKFGPAAGIPDPRISQEDQLPGLRPRFSPQRASKTAHMWRPGTPERRSGTVPRKNGAAPSPLGSWTPLTSSRLQASHCLSCPHCTPRRPGGEGGAARRR
jgi:hypothetical protein